MDAIMAFLMKWIRLGHVKWQALTKLPTIQYKNLTVDYSIVGFMILVWILMWLLLP